MGKGKLAKFADMDSYPNVFQYPFSVLAGHLSGESWQAPPSGDAAETPSVPICGHWREEFFHNDNPIVLELGCGKGEYAVSLAAAHPDCNYIGVDIKGARMWTGATMAIERGIGNVAFLRTNIEFIHHFFAAGEVQQIWLTFSDPQMKNPRKRLTSSFFLRRYQHFLEDGGVVHLKTDSNFLFTYTDALLAVNRLPLLASTADLYADANNGDTRLAEAAAIKTYYEKMWLARGLTIKYVQFQLPASAELVEPDIEIPLDDYRSYHRDKRSPKQTAK
jgi:tRNA (guanine-N7-)-methyltransferase